MLKNILVFWRWRLIALLCTCLININVFGQQSFLTSNLGQDNTSNLIKNNPFVSSSDASQNKVTNQTVTTKVKPTQSAVLQRYLEFKSIAIINNKKYFSILNKRTNDSDWYPEYETVKNLRVSNYDPINNTINISDGINTETIAISTASEKPLVVTGTSIQPAKEQASNPTPVLPSSNTNNAKKSTPRRRVIPVKR